MRSFGLALLIAEVFFSLQILAESNSCIQPPTSDDPKVDERLRIECEANLKRQKMIADHKDQMKQVKEKACTKDCSPSEKKSLSQNYEIYCASYCQSIVPQSLQSQISCTADRMCSPFNSSEENRWSQATNSCIDEIPNGAKTFAQQTATAADSLVMAPKRLTDSLFHFSKTVYKDGFHQALNDELVSADRSVREKVKAVKALPSYISSQYETMKCLDPEVAIKLACNMGTALVLNAVSGSAAYKLGTALAKSSMINKAYELTAKELEGAPPLKKGSTERGEIASVEPDLPQNGQMEINPETGLPVFPKEAVSKNETGLRKPPNENDILEAKALREKEIEGRRLQISYDLYAAEKAKGHPNVLFMERAGYVFDPKKSEVPSSDKIAQTFKEEIDVIAKKEGLKPEEVFDVVKPYKLPNGEIAFIKYGDPIPPGAKASTIELEHNEFINLVAEGKFPLGDGEVVPDIPMTLKEHDVSHLSSFIEHPQAMAELIKQARTLRDSGKMDAVYDPKNQQVRNSTKWKIHHALESSSYYSSKVQRRYSGLRGLQPKSVVRPKDISSNFKGASRDELSGWLKTVKRTQESEVQHFGGAQRDVISRNKGAVYLELDRTLQVENEIKRLEELSQTDPKRFEREARTSLPIIISTQWNYSQLTPMTYVRGAFQAETPEGRLLKEVHCRSKGFSSENEIKIRRVYGC